MSLYRHLVLMGLRASGKSTLGAAAAQALGARFVDLDDRTREILGAATVRDAFRDAGEGRFRAAEANALAAALGEAPQVIALGGGTPTAPGARELLEAARGAGRVYVVFLDLPLPLLAERLAAHEGDRPSLTGRGVVAELEVVAAARRPLYAALTDVRLLEPLRQEELVSIIASQVCSDSSTNG